MLAGWLTHPDGDNYFADLPMVQRGYRLVVRIYRAIRSGAVRVAQKIRRGIGLAVRIYRANCWLAGRAVQRGGEKIVEWWKRWG